MLDEPLPQKLFRELALGLALGKFFLVSFGVEIAAGVGGVNFVDEVHFAVALAKLVLGVDEDEALARGNFLSASKQSAGVIFDNGVIFFAYEALGNDFFARNVEVVALICLGGGGDDGFGEALVFFHPVGQTYAAQFATSVFVGAPCRAGENGTDNHFYTKTFALQTYGDHWVGCGKFPVGTDVGGEVEKLRGNLIEHLSFKWNAFGQNNVEGRNAVGGNHHDFVVVDVVHIAHFTVINAALLFKMKIGVC